MFSIKFDIDELPPEPGDICRYCKLPIEGVKFVPFIQVGDVTDGKYLEPMCKYCYQEKFIDDNKTPT